MMPRALKICSVAECPEVTSSGRCIDCQRKAEQKRGNPAERGYGGAHRAFRRAVLRRDPLCVIPLCLRPSQHADHYPLSLRELRALGVNPYEPKRGRGLCASHHSSETAKHQPGGWAVR